MSDTVFLVLQVSFLVGASVALATTELTLDHHSAALLQVVELILCREFALAQLAPHMPLWTKQVSVRSEFRARHGHLTLRTGHGKLGALEPMGGQARGRKHVSAVFASF